MLNEKIGAPAPQPTPQQIAAVRAAESYDALRTRVMDWVYDIFSNKNAEFIETFNFLTQALDSEAAHLLQAIYPFDEKDYEEIDWDKSFSDVLIKKTKGGKL